MELISACLFFPCSDEHSGKVKSFMLDVLSPLITEADFVSNELLDIILVNIVEPQKTQRKNAFMLAKELIMKTSATLEAYIQAFFNQVGNKNERTDSLCCKDLACAGSVCTYKRGAGSSRKRSPPTGLRGPRGPLPFNH